jgi:hypothetical protein
VLPPPPPPPHPLSASSSADESESKDVRRVTAGLVVFFCMAFRGFLWVYSCLLVIGLQEIFQVQRGLCCIGSCRVKLPDRCRYRYDRHGYQFRFSASEYKP